MGELVPTVRAVGILVLTLVWVQMGVREIWENQAFVDGYCHRPYNNRFIGGYCAVHSAAADYTSIKNLLHTFCLAGIWPMVITAVLVVAANQMLISMGIDVVASAVHKATTPPPMYRPSVVSKGAKVLEDNLSALLDGGADE